MILVVQDGYSPLHLATLSGKVETVELLLELGASNINETTDVSKTRF